MAARRLKRLAASLLLLSLLAMPFANAVRSGANSNPVSPWLREGEVALTELSGIGTRERTDTVWHNRNCRKQKMITQKGLWFPLPQKEISNIECVVDTLYGALDENYLPPGATLAGKLKDFNGGTLRLLPVPNTFQLLRFTGNSSYRQVDIYSYAPGAIERHSPPGATKNIEYRLTGAPDRQLRDASGQLVRLRFDTVAFSANSKWLVGETSFGFVRVSLETFEVVPFGTGFNYNIGRAPTPQTAVSNDGRYAAVGSSRHPRLDVYDIEACPPTPTSITARDCPKNKVWWELQAKYPGLRGPSYIRFSGSHTITFYMSFPEDPSGTSRWMSATAPGENPAGYEYLALGDSFASGEGAFNYKSFTDIENNKCHLSLSSYPYLIATAVNFNSYESVACSGARIFDITTVSNEDYNKDPQAKQKLDPSFDGEIFSGFLPGYRPQWRFLESYKPSAITISVGGNDIGFVNKLARCLEPDTCYDSYEDRLEIFRHINEQLHPLSSTYAKLKEDAAPGARIYAVGYPILAKPDGDCALNVRLNTRELELARELVRHLNDVIELAAASAGVFYVDTEDAFAGHRLCEIDSYMSAVNGLTAGNDIFAWLGGPIGNESYHPNQRGHRMLKEVILGKTVNLTAPMPAILEEVTLPSETDHPLLDAQPTGRAIHRVNYDHELGNDLVYRGGAWNGMINGLKYSLIPLNTYGVFMQSEPTRLGEFQTDAAGNIEFEVSIPEGTPPGFHTIHVYPTNIEGETINIQKIIYVAASEDDFDGDGIPNSDEACLYGEAGGEDADQDSIDDACDGFIDLPPPEPVQEEDQTNSEHIGEDLNLTEPPISNPASEASPHQEPLTSLDRESGGQSVAITTVASTTAGSNPASQADDTPQPGSPLVTTEVLSDTSPDDHNETSKDSPVVLGQQTPEPAASNSLLLWTALLGAAGVFILGILYYVGSSASPEED